ncbi:diflavin flavoprotein [Romeria aff. gracilis LEGE 07310]|uniref:Diflavin flavoprotein n=1 Tax=Vasconcelosia minhoensis LEGE 07310 TaxID=915328 RepID=A0A8J7AC90_9CYAN|nr:diflavin flavoprotein [Romeria gracilis]MBE9077009.1 diflavin flavoprotein [Romeria aff. gracilis LEGE 07310]
MVALVDSQQSLRPQRRLTLQTAEIAPDSFAIRCLDWDRDRFDIEFDLQNGTTYNSFLIRGDQLALIDTSHRKFRELYLDYLFQQVDPAELSYLIVNHTEPDHSGLVEEILDWAPHITVVGSKVAIQFLENMVHRPFTSMVVKSGHQLDLGRGHELEFVSAPNLHWPDTIFTYDAGTNVLYTCDVFGMHYCNDFLYDEVPDLMEADFQYYYDCLMGPNARSVLMALKRIDKFSVDLIATGHGPLLQHHRADWVERYRDWSQNQTQSETFVALFYRDEYGYSDRIVRAIADGIAKTGVAVELVDLTVADSHEVRELVKYAAGLVIGMPPQTDQIAAAHPGLSTILATATSRQAIGLFETGGGQDEPIYPLRNQFREIGLTEAFPPILIKTAPNEATDQLCDEAGTDLGQWLIQNQMKKPGKSLDSDLDRALGRISNGLYIVTAKKNDVSSAMLASWVIQASLNPLGVAIAVSKDRAIESLLHVGDCFVLNVLEEARYQPLMRHFLKRFPPGADRFAGVETYTAFNGSPILAESLAYMECEVTSRLDCSDHWIVYGTVQTGRVAKRDGLTAVHHRKAGNHY